MANQAIIVLDCGGTNLRAVAIDPSGVILAIASRNNTSQRVDLEKSFYTWDLNDILKTLQCCCLDVISQLNDVKIIGLTVTTFGVDGGLLDENQQLLYPIISWKCPRTLEAVTQIEAHFSQSLLQKNTGVGFFSFNTLYKLIWLKNNKPKIYSQAKTWLFISSLITHYLTGELTTDRTMAGTSQIFDIHENQFNADLLNYLEIDSTFFPTMLNAGEQIGLLKQCVAQEFNLPLNLPVICAGHDTQFALFGSGADINQAVLSSGTWEILMLRTHTISLEKLANISNSTCELDLNPKLINPGIQWIASGMLEKMRCLLWDDKTPYKMIIDAASKIPIGSDNIRINPDFLIKNQLSQGSITGLCLNSSKAAIFRASLEALSFKLKFNFNELCSFSNTKPSALILVGGGSKNTLWNQIKADVLNIPIKIPNASEITVLGAAMVAFSAVKLFKNPEESRNNFNISYQTITPNTNNARLYESLNY
ncbi:L-fuculokinase [Gammaproteobacteria bacterium]|nr:L-fuculokinase [Gammaproteobacteria bacterium]